jgi:hypothetical protein
VSGLSASLESTLALMGTTALVGRLVLAVGMNPGIQDLPEPGRTPDQN